MGFTTNNVIWVCPKIGLYIMTYDDHCNENDDQRFFWYIFSDKPKRLNGLRMDYISPFYINPRCYVRICSSGWWFETCFIFPIQLGIITSTDYIICFRGVGLNHQLDYY